MPKLTDPERDAFLSEPGVILHLATLHEGAPAVIPIWFIYEEGAIWFTPRAQSAWLGDLRRDARASLAIDEQSLPYRKVVIEGRAELAYDLGKDDAWRDRYRRIARRYITPEAAEDYVQNTIDQERALFRVPLAGSIVRTWRMPVGDEPGHGIWHRRYYAPGTKMAPG
jgi:nitroimidazol reductase NimA-like FMN-containing flavoprotein (pyridoxamine 5'-phosphate oxidase superfamily)